MQTSPVSPLSQDEDVNIPPSPQQSMEATAKVDEDSVKPTWFSDESGNLRLVNHVIKRPWCSCCSVLLICLIMTILLGVIVSQEGNFITSTAHNYDVVDVRSKQYDSWRLAREHIEEKRNEAENAGVVDRKQSLGLDSLYWIYEAETDGGMFTKKALADMKEAEGVMLNHVDWDKYCVLEHENRDGSLKPESEVTCETSLSATRIFYPTGWDGTLAQSVIERLKIEANVEMFNKVAPCLDMATGSNTSTGGNVNQDLIDNCNAVLADVSDADVSTARQLRGDISAITSQWTGTGELVQNPQEVALFCAYLKLLPTFSFQVDFYFDKNFNVNNPVSLFARTFIEFGGPLDGFDRIEEDKTAQQDLVKDWIVNHLFDDMEHVASKSHSSETNAFYFMGALFFDVFVSVLMQDALLAVVSVLMVFSYLWYMIGSLFLASVGMSQILLSLPCAWFLFRGIFQIKFFSGMNSLTIFVVCAIGADDIFVFMDAYKQSAHQGPAVNRNLATRMSWVWRKAGTAMAITSATTCTAFLATLFTPISSTRSFGIFAALVILWDYVLVMSLFCTAVIIYHNRFERPPACEVPYLCGCCTENCECGNQKPSPTEQTLTSFHDGIDVPQDRVTKFFSTTFTDLVLSVRGRILIAVVLIAWLIPATIFVFRLEPTETAEQFLADDHPLQYSMTLLNNEFPVSSQDTGLAVFFAWGVDTLDHGGVNQLLAPDFLGEPVFKEEFEFSPSCQGKMTEVCNDLEFTRTENRTSLLKADDSGFSIVRCVMRSFQSFAAAEGYTDGSTDSTVPLERVNDAVKAYFASPPSGFDSLGDINANLGWDGERVRFVAVEVESQVLNEFSNLPEDTTRGEYDEFVKLAAYLDDKVGDACGARGVLMTDLEQKFVFMNNQKIYRNSAVQGAAIGVTIAFVVLLFATRSPLLAALSTLSIIGTILSVIGSVVMIGWTLGTVEAILIAILAGFSVDYVVHLAHAYAGSKGSTEERVRHAFGEMGTPVLSGMITSVLASLPLFACEIMFFSKFGTFLCFTILCSWVFANFGFMALVTTVGQASKHDAGAESQASGLGVTTGHDKPADVTGTGFGQAVFASPNPA